jgi:isoamylase
MPFTTRPYPLGATVNPDGVNFALYSETAAGVELVLFDDPAGPPARVVPLDNCTKHVFHTLVSGVAAGQLYGYRVSGPFDPGQGLRFNEHKLLIDPYAKAITGKVANVDNLLLGYNPASPARDLSRDTRDNVAIVPKSIVIDDRFDWQDDRPPDHAFHRSVIYEVHLK